MRPFHRGARPVAIVVLLSVFLAFSCYTVPITQRKAFILIDQTTEFAMGLEAYQQVKQETPISYDPELNAQVQRVGRRVAAATGFTNYEWEFTVFDGPDTVNAFCLPGGKIGVYTGILPITQNDAGLACIVGHEIGHAVARHGAERVSQGLLVAVGAAALESATKSEEEEDREMWMAAYGIGTTLFALLPHSRTQELEADRIGLVYMAKAGYDPREGVALWERFAAYSREHGGPQIEFLSTHPTDERRIARIRQLLPEAMSHYEQATGIPSAGERQPGIDEIDHDDIPRATIRPESGRGKRVFRGVKLHDE